LVWRHQLCRTYHVSSRENVVLDQPNYKEKRETCIYNRHRFVQIEDEIDRNRPKKTGVECLNRI